MSSLKDLASLIMIPSLYKDGRLDTVKPLGNSIIHPDATGNNDGTDGSTPAEGNFTFSRGSNLAATRVDVNGLIEKGRENLLLQSNQFDTTWTLTSGSSIVNGQSGYDSTNNAWLLTDSGYAGSYALYQSISNSGLLTASIYAKAASTNVIELDFFGSPSPSVQVNLTTGSITNALNHIDAQSVSVGNGWWRISITGNLSSTSFIRVGCDGAGSIYIQDAQLEAGLVATDYIETGASTAQAGILEDMPRLDYSGGASCPALLLEPQRTNLIPQSEYLEHSSWVKNVNASVSQNYATSPEGKQNASLISNTLVGGSCDYYVNLTGSASTTYTLSAFVKASTHSKCVLRAYVGHGADQSTPAAIFDLSNGTIVQEYGVATNVDITPFNDEWYKVQISFLTAGTNLYFNILPLSDSYGWATAYNAPINYGSTGGILAYAAQVEAGSYPTSYIPTYGSSVTRSVDICKLLSSPAIVDQDNCTAFIEYEYGNSTGSSATTILGIHDGGSTANRIQIVNRYSGITLFSAASGSTYVSNATIASSLSKGDVVKIALVINTEGITAFYNGTKVYTPTAAPVWSATMDDLFVGSRSGVGEYGTGQGVKQVAMYPTALTDSECIALTTL